MPWRNVFKIRCTRGSDRDRRHIRAFCKHGREGSDGTTNDVFGGLRGPAHVRCLHALVLAAREAFENTLNGGRHVYLAGRIHYFAVSLGLRYRGIEAALDVENVLDGRWREVQVVTTSRVAYEPQAVIGLHMTPGWPRTLMARVAINFA